MAEAEALCPSESMNTWSLDIRFIKPSVSCALIAFTNLCAISAAVAFFVCMLISVCLYRGSFHLALNGLAISTGEALNEIIPTSVTSVPISCYLSAALKNPPQTHDLINMPEPTDSVQDPADNDFRENDRRRSPRFICGGRAEINCLPSTGIVLPGTIRDLSLHGCCVDTSLPIDCGVRAEVVVRVNASSFRAVGEVRAIRGHSGSGLEFIHLSTGGRDMLAGLVTDLARLRAVMSKLKSIRRETDAEAFRKELEYGELQAVALSERFPLLKTIPPAGRSEDSLEQDGSASSVNDRNTEAQSLVITVNLFG